MIPTIGRIVIVRHPSARSNGAETAPATVTRVWKGVDTRNEPSMVNITAFPDLSPAIGIGSVTLYDTEEEANAVVGPLGAAAWWPPRA